MVLQFPLLSGPPLSEARIVIGVRRTPAEQEGTYWHNTARLVVIVGIPGGPWSFK